MNKDKKLARRNPFQKAEDSAREAAKARKGIASCPYSKNPYKAYWLKSFFSYAQIDMFGQKVDN